MLASFEHISFALLAAICGSRRDHPVPLVGLGLCLQVSLLKPRCATSLLVDLELSNGLGSALSLQLPQVPLKWLLNAFSFTASSLAIDFLSKATIGSLGI